MTYEEFYLYFVLMIAIVVIVSLMNVFGSLGSK